MSSAAFEELRIERLDGLSPPFRLAGLSPGINVIYGANGTGKSRTADALMHALWPARLRDSSDRAHLIARLRIGDQLWRIEIDNDRITQNRGADTANSSPPIPSAAVCSRYRLSLHELLQADDSDLASAILKESIGGYDLNAASQDLEISKPARRAPKEVAALRDATQAVREASGKQAKLAEQESRLRQLYSDRAAARSAEDRAVMVRAALHRHQLRDEHQLALERVASFHPIFSRLTGDELRQLQQLQSTAHQTENDLDRLSRKRDDSLALLQQLGPAIQQAGATLIGTLREQCRVLSDLDRRIQDAKQRLAEHAQQADAERKWLDSNATEEHLAALRISDLQAINQWADRFEKNRGAHLAVEQAIALAAHSTPAIAPLEVIGEALRLTSRWLAQPDERATSGHVSRFVFAGMGVIVLLAALLAAMVHWLWILASAGALSLLPLLRRNEQPDARPEIQRRYTALPVAPPTQWNRSDVEALQFTLWAQRAQAELEQLQSQRRADLGRQLLAIAQQASILESQRKALAGQLGVDPNLDANSMLIFATHLLRWREAQNKVVGPRAGLEAVTREREHLWGEAIALLSPFTSAPSHLAALASTIDNLDDRIGRRNQAMQDAEQATTELDAVLKPRRVKNRAELDGFFRRLEITPEDEAKLQEWLGQLPAYKSAVEALAISKERLRESDALLTRGGLELPDDREVLRTLLDTLEAQAARLDPIQQEIATIEGVAQAYRTGSMLQDALARQRDAADALRRHRDANSEMGVAYVLAEHLRTQMRDRNRPPVFRHAQQLFERLTLGRFRLDFNDAEPPAFTAQHSGSHETLKLNELSSGTRLQLLLSVRLAFVQEQEQGIKAPLFFDETLGNSDEERAAAVIQAIMEIAREGRQVFYFTAQTDEAAKWRDSLQSSGIAYRLIDLAEVRNLDAAERTPLQRIESAMKPRIPSSAGLSRLEYGRVLQVPGLRPDLQQAGGVHLWHLLDDMALLERLLTLGVRDWGAWQTLYKHGPQWVDAAAFSKAQARAKLIDALAAQWRIGRGRRVDRHALQQSEGVSGTYLDAVANLAEELDGNAADLIDRLYSRGIRGFGSGRVTALELALEQHGYLDRRERIPVEQLRLRALAAVGGELQAGLLNDADVENYLAVFTSEAASLSTGSEPS